MTNELYTFVKESLEKGMDRSAIHAVLAQAGWQEEEIKNALSAFSDVPFAVPVPKPKPDLQAREAFLYLISFITLYITAFSFGALIFSFIDRLYADPVSYYSRFSTGGVTTALASIIIAFPVYLFMMWRLGKAAAKDPERRQSKIARWLTYITLVVAASIIIGDLIALLANLLRGGLTTPFFLKALTILAVTGSIFGYYLWGLQKEEREEKEKSEGIFKPRHAPVGLRIFTAIVLVGVVFAAGYGFILVGSPATQRLIQLDERRVSDLENITYAIDAYWQRNKILPQSFENLKDQQYYVQSIQDPKTGEPYEYRVFSDVTYELCAVFEADSSQIQQRERYPKPFSSQVWDHAIGRTCFERKIQETKQLEPTFIPHGPIPAR